MPLSAKVRTNYSGETLGACGGPALNRLTLIGREDRGRFPLLYGVDPYSNTAFNRLQMEQLREELTIVLAESSDIDVLDMATELLALTAVVLEGFHRSLVFFGD